MNGTLLNDADRGRRIESPAWETPGRRIPVTWPCWLIAGLALAALTGCLSVKTEPIRVEPIHITMDVNLKVQGALNDFFGDLDEQSNIMVYEEPEDSNSTPE